MSTRTELATERLTDDAHTRAALTVAGERARGWISRYVIWLWERDEDVAAAREACEAYASRLDWQLTGYYADPIVTELPAASDRALDQLRAALSDVIVTTAASFERMSPQQQADLLTEAERTQCSVSVLDRS